MTLAIQDDRLAQLLMKSDPTLGLDAARIQLERAALVITIGGAQVTGWGQAALLTIAECGVRSFRGGVYLDGEFDELVHVGGWMRVPLKRMLIAAGCRAETPPPHALRVHIGADGSSREARLSCWTDGWVAGVGPSGPKDALRPGNEISGALAGAMLVTAAFRMSVLGDLVAARRTQRLSPLTPKHPNPEGIGLDLLPSAMWLLGLGNLGQAVLWVLGLLPYRDPGAVHVVLQDIDRCGPENQDIQILTRVPWIGQRKARASAEWAEARGFQTTINEVPFGPDTVRDPSSPGLALVGVDNIETRRHAARLGSGFDLVIDAGLGATPAELFDLRIHVFPGSREPLAAWPEIPPTPSEVTLQPDLQKLVLQGRLDQCGALSIAGQAVGMPSTAVAAATIQIAQALRAIREGRICDFVDASLANTARTVTHEVEVARARALLFEESRTGGG